MISRKRIIITALVCIMLGALSYFAWLFPFYEFTTSDYSTSVEKLLSAEYIKTLVPLLIIIGLSAVGIALCVFVRKLMIKADKRYSRFANVRAGKARGNAPKQTPAIYMVVRWIVMIVFSRKNM